VLPEGIFEAATPVEGRPGSFRILGDIEEVNLELERLLAAGGRVASFGPETGGLESAFRSAVGEGP
jgi:hypothetical protein